MAKHHKRKNFFIKKNFQGKLILSYFLFITGGSLFFILLLGIFSADTLTISYTNHDLQFGQTPLILLKKVLAAHWIFIASGAVFTIIAAMLITHRIAGPLFRFERALDNMLQKDLTDNVALRTKDEGKELAKKINAFNRDLSTTFIVLQGHSNAITTLLEQASTQSSDVSKEELNELKSIIWSVKENNKKIRALCSAYTLRDE
jgi:methyl-accepting chemotaxis protein